MKNLYLIKYLAIACAPLCACAGEFSDSSKYALNPKGVELSNTQDAPYVTIKEEAEEGEEDSFLPIFGKEARERGYELPNPYGIGVNYMHIRQDIDVKSITFGGLSLKINNIFRPNKPTIIDIPSDLFKIDVHSTKQRSHTETIRADAWLFPFMNVYAVAGRTKGKSVSKIDVGSTNPFVNNIIKGIGDMDGLDFILKFKGTTYGLGTTFAGGVGNWFGLLDLNYTKTDLNIIKGDIKAFTLSPRVGYRFTLPAAESIGLPQSKFNFWVGAMYYSVQQNFRGNLTNLSFSPKLQQIISAVNWHGNGEFNVEQRIKSPWNMLTGFRWEITPNFNWSVEAGYLNKFSFLTALECRF